MDWKTVWKRSEQLCFVEVNTVEVSNKEDASTFSSYLAYIIDYSL